MSFSSSTDDLDNPWIRGSVWLVGNGRIMMPLSIIREFVGSPDSRQFLFRPDATSLSSRSNISELFCLLGSNSTIPRRFDLGTLPCSLGGQSWRSSLALILCSTKDRIACRAPEEILDRLDRGRDETPLREHIQHSMGVRLQPHLIAFDGYLPDFLLMRVDSVQHILVLVVPVSRRRGVTAVVL